MPRRARTRPSAGARQSGTTTHAAEAAPAAERGVAEAGADVGERLVDERLEALARLDGEAAHGVGGVRRECSRCGDLLGECEQAVRRGARPARRRAASRRRPDRSRRPRAALRASSRTSAARRWRREPSKRLWRRSGANVSPRDGQRGGERAALAARHARQADLRAEVEERLVPVPGAARRRRHVGRAERALEHAAHVDVERRHLGAEREARDRARGVRADAGQRSSSPTSRGNSPSSTTRRAAFWRLSARRL